MAKDSDPLADAFGGKETGGLFSSLLAEEGSFDRRMLWRLGSWGATAVGAVVVAVLANQAHLGWRRDQVASADLARQSDRLQVLTKESQLEARRLTSAVDTLNTDRDRLYARVTVLEQGLDSVTGAIAKQSAAPVIAPQASAAKPQDTPAIDAQPAPSVAPVASTPAPSRDKQRAAAAKEQAKESPKDTVREAANEQPSLPPQTAAAASLVPLTTPAIPMLPLVPPKSIMAPPDPAASKLIQPESTEKAAEKTPEVIPAPTEVAAAPAKPPEATEAEAPAIAVQQTRFAIDLGGANSVDGLRALWRGLSKSNPEIATLRPIIMIKEGNSGLGMQLRLGAGPLVNAAAAAKLCAGLAENDRHCETTVFDGQRLSMRGSEKGQDKSQDKSAEKNQDSVPQAETAPASLPAAKPDKHRRSYSSKRSSKREEPAPTPQPAAPAAKPETASAGSTISSFFRR